MPSCSSLAVFALFVACGPSPEPARPSTTTGDPVISDSDGDGVLDAVDGCLQAAEDLDGFEDDDGCPEFDNDGDGFLDECDECPFLPETYEGSNHEDGCPEGRVIVEADGDAHVDIRKIYFTHNSARLRRVDLQTVDAIANLMDQNPQLLRVGVHGNSAHNERRPAPLSQQRADVVIEALVARGVEPTRLVPYADGRDRLLDERNTEEAHELNRRIEFLIEEVAETQPSAPPPPPPSSPRPPPIVPPRPPRPCPSS